ncbi:unnamed protein product [Hermetia illucens]|uniref:CCHC-type domain-containing protein n=1 Tax=Hermetia illucens TaxID=343691 RepID=A0A7R8V378_HERIL|nr:uncharacterized protein LOC119659539 [Hermetia illucens]CAD7091928.1 unnamed protein product [Hermetia illucens]
MSNGPPVKRYRREERSDSEFSEDEVSVKETKGMKIQASRIVPFRAANAEPADPGTPGSFIVWDREYVSPPDQRTSGADDEPLCSETEKYSGLADSHRCSHCDGRGHCIAECRKLKAVQSRKEWNVEDPDSSSNTSEDD